MNDEVWGNLPIPNIYKELEGEFLDFDFEEEILSCKFPVLSKFFNPLDITLGGILDSYMDCTMGPLSYLLGERVVTKSFEVRYIKSVSSSSVYVVSKAWRESHNEKESIYKAELYLDSGELAATSQGVFVTPKAKI